MDVPWYRRLVDDPKPARFETSLPIHEAVSRLAAETSRWRRISLTEYLRGRVSQDYVWLQRRGPFFGASWQQVFAGHFETNDGGVSLVGTFGVARSTRYFMYFAIALGLAWSAVAFWIMHEEPRPEDSVWPALAGIIVSAFIPLIGRFARRIRRSDVSWLSERIAAALSATSR
jgi:hypothetical protein